MKTNLPISHATFAALGLDRNSRTNSSWTVRRRIIALSLVFCAVTVWYILFKGIDTETARAIISNTYYLAIAVVGSYIGGATWDDKNKINALVNSGAGTAPVAPAAPGTSNSSMPAGDPPPGN